MRKFHRALCITGLFVCACAPVEVAAPPPNFGNAVSQNLAVQVANPQAPTGTEAMTLDGSRAVVGQGRYITDTVEPPQDMRTTRVGVGQGGGGPGGAGAAPAR